MHILWQTTKYNYPKLDQENNKNLSLQPYIVTHFSQYKTAQDQEKTELQEIRDKLRPRTESVGQSDKSDLSKDTQVGLNTFSVHLTSNQYI